MARYRKRPVRRIELSDGTVMLVRFNDEYGTLESLGAKPAGKPRPEQDPDRKEGVDGKAE